MRLRWLLLTVPIGAPILFFVFVWIVAGFRNSTSSIEGPSLAAIAIAESPSPSNRSSVFTKLWLGHYPLWAAFWVFYLFGLFVAFAICAVMLIVAYQLHVGTLGFIIGFVLVNVYWIAAAVGVWRSAATSYASPIWMDRLWAGLARLVILASAARALLALINGGALWLAARMTAPMDF